MPKVKFIPIINGHDLYIGLVKDGLLISEKMNKTNENHLFIIGIDMSYDTVTYRDYVRFIILPISENKINQVYDFIFDKKKVNLDNRRDIISLKFQKIIEFNPERKISLRDYFDVDFERYGKFIGDIDFVSNLIEK